MDTFTAVYDACVLYPAQLRNLLMWLALSGLFRARWRSTKSTPVPIIGPPSPARADDAAAA